MQVHKISSLREAGGTSLINEPRALLRHLQEQDELPTIKMIGDGRWSGVWVEPLELVSKMGSSNKVSACVWKGAPFKGKKRLFWMLGDGTMEHKNSGFNITHGEIFDCHMAEEQTRQSGLPELSSLGGSENYRFVTYVGESISLSVTQSCCLTLCLVSVARSRYIVLALCSQCVCNSVSQVVFQRRLVICALCTASWTHSGAQWYLVAWVVLALVAISSSATSSVGTSALQRLSHAHIASCRAHC